MGKKERGRSKDRFPAQGREVPAFETVFWRGKEHRHCVVIPVLNEGRRIVSLLSRMTSCGTHEVADIVIIDGGTTDGSLDPDKLLAQHVCALLIKKGPGKLGGQLRCAYSFAIENGYAGVITIDGNDKDDPKSIPSFISALEQGVDFVQASRFIIGGRGENTPLIRLIAIRLIHAPMLSLSSGFHWTDTTQGFRAYSGRLLMDPRIAVFRAIFSRYELLAYLSYRAPRLGYRCVELPTIRRYPPDEVPTKIKGFKGNLELMRTLILTCLGRFNP